METHGDRPSCPVERLTASCGLYLDAGGLPPSGMDSLHILTGVHRAVGSWGRHVSAQGLWTHMASTGSASRQLAEATPVQLRTRCGPWWAGNPLVAPVACMLCLVSMVQWGHGAGTALHRDCGHTWRIEGKATSSPQVPLRAWCGPWRVAGRLSPGCPGSLHVLLAVHGTVGSWGRHRTAQGLWACTASRGSASRQLAAATLLRLRAWCGPWRAGGGLSPPGTGSSHVLLGVHGAVGS